MSDKPDTFYRYFRVTKTTPNPTYDRRHRYGGKSVKEFTEGSFIRAYIGDGYPAISKIGITSEVSARNLPPLSEWTVEESPDDWTLFRGEYSTHSDYVLRELFRRGIVTYAIAKEILDDEDDES